MARGVSVQRCMGLGVAALAAASATERVCASGPDLYLLELGTNNDIREYGVLGDIAALAIATASCNAGTAPANWYDWDGAGSPGSQHHPVFAQNMYRLRDGRFEQIGMSWVKHGYCASNAPGCGVCQSTGTCNSLGVQCVDHYSSLTNGSGLKPRSDINAATGEFPFPPSFGAIGPVEIAGRLQVRVADLDPVQNPSARYFVEAEYIALDDASAGNGLNNVSWREVSVVSLTEVNTLGPTAVMQPALAAWAASDPQVVLTQVTLDGDGRLYAAGRASPLGEGQWHYEYAIYNMNSHRSGGSLRVPLSPRAAVSNVGFHDVDYHSGEIYDVTDWSAAVEPCRVSWSTAPFAQNANANALRWATLYNFRFDADAPPGAANVALGLFRPGSPEEVTFALPGPVLPCPGFDRDGDWDIDLDDFGAFQRCITGPDGGPGPSGCAFADGDSDGDVDGVDVEMLIRCSNGPEVGYAGGCP